MRLLDIDAILAPEPKRKNDTPYHNQWGYHQEQVLSNITHDLRGPLSAIMGYLDLVGRQVEKSAPGKAVEYLTLAREAGQRMNQMVSDLLDMFRFENGDSFLKRQHVPVSGLLEKVYKTFSGLADLKKVKLFCRAPKTPLIAWVDPRFISRVLDNLVANAIKFTPAGGSVDVSARSARERTLFEVADTGRGIPPIDRKRIFEKFQHVRRGDNRRGYGMGLAVVRTILQAHQGAISVRSHLGKGSRFTFWVPNE